MRILIAPNSMKGSLNAFDFADTVEAAFLNQSKSFEIRKLPVADGGDFTGEVLARNLGAKTIEVEVEGPLGKKLLSKYAKAGNIAIIEMADASGMKLVQTTELNPLKASSVGTGQLIADALKSGCKEVLLAIGGSATVDGGIGMMAGLGFHFLDESGNKLEACGKALKLVRKIVPPVSSPKPAIRIVCDVDNPLLGERGAAAVFGPQKGATEKMVAELEEGLENWAFLLEKQCGQDLRSFEGAGAAGGMALPLIAYFSAEIVSGADFVLKQLNFSEQVDWADLVITGEGKIDGQTLGNKAPFAVAKLAREKGKPVIAFGGKVEAEAGDAFDGIYTLVNGPMTLEYAMSESKQLLYQSARQVARTLLALKR